MSTDLLQTEPQTHTSDHHVTRRRALGAGAVASAGLLLALGRTPADAADAACATLTPEKTIGPYFVEEGLDRSDIRTDPATGTASPGTRLTLDLTLLDESTAACSPLQGAQVDVWHASAAGKYSDEASEGTSGAKYLRGYQTSDASGKVAFTTIIPGWYSGRAVHIHVRIRKFGASGTATYDFLTQLFFDDAFLDGVYQQAPYNTRGSRDTRDANDGIYGSDGASLLLAPTSDGDGGYRAAFTFGLPASADGDSGGAGGGAPGGGGTPPGGTPPTGTPGTTTTGTTTTPSTSTTGTGTTTTPGTTTSSSGASTSSSDTAVQAALRSAAFTRTALGTRVLVVRLKAEEAVAVDLRLLRGSTRLKRKRALQVPAGTTRLRVPLANGIAAGRATLQLAVTDGAGNERTLIRVVQVPKR